MSVDDVFALVERIDLTRPLELARRPGRARRWPPHIANEIALEYRRFLVLAALFPDREVCPPPDVGAFAALHAEGGSDYEDACSLVSPALPLSPRLLDPATSRTPSVDLYDAVFPTGARHYWMGGLTTATRPAQTPSPVTGAADLVPVGLAFDRRTREELRAEADLSLLSGRLHEEDAFAVSPSGTVRGPSRFWAGMSGPRLRAVHESAATIALVSAFARRRVYPTRATYLRYDPGHFLGLHTDVPSCEVTVLLGLGDTAGPVHTHPELAGRPLAELAELARSCGGHPDGGIRSDIRTGLLFRGSVVPHHRPPVGATTFVATMCYDALA